MNIKNDKEKNNLFIQDVNTNDKDFTNKIFKYFYSLFQEKKEFKIFLKFILIFIETIQLISYAFTSTHFYSWKLKVNIFKPLAVALGAAKLTFLMRLIGYKIYSAISYCLIILIFILCLIVLLNILFMDSSSKLYRCSSTIIHSLIDLISTILYIPISEIILYHLKCTDGNVHGFTEKVACWHGIHYLNVVLGIIGAIG